MTTWQVLHCTTARRDRFPCVGPLAICATDRPNAPEPAPHRTRRGVLRESRSPRALPRCAWGRRCGGGLGTGNLAQDQRRPDRPDRFAVVVPLPRCRQPDDRSVPFAAPVGQARPRLVGCQLRRDTRCFRCPLPRTADRRAGFRTTRRRAPRPARTSSRGRGIPEAPDRRRAAAASGGGVRHQPEHGRERPAHRLPRARGPEGAAR